MIANFDSIMSWVVPIGGWVNLSGVGGPLKFRGGGVEKRDPFNFKLSQVIFTNQIDIFVF